MWEEWNEGGMGKLTERRKGGEPMKKRKPLSALGKAQMEMAGSLTPDLEGQAHSRQHDGRGVHQEGIDWGRMHDDDRSTITPHLGRKGGEY